MKNNEKTILESPKKLLKELHSLVTEAEKLVRNSKLDTSNDEESETFRARLDRTQALLENLYTDTKDCVSAGAKSADISVRANPYQSLAIAAGIGLLVGALTSHHSK